MTEQKITPCLWFDSNAEEAVTHYLSIFPNSRILSTARYGEFAPGQKGAVMTVFFEIDGQRFLALNGGPHYKFTPAISLMVNCDDQAEIDALWEKLAEGGEHVQCGWLTDKFGVSWQIVPRILPELLGGDAGRTDRVMRAVMGMKKLDIAQMELAASPQQASSVTGPRPGTPGLPEDEASDVTEERHGQRHLRFLRLPRSNDRSWRGERAHRPASK
jgi:predicted 3-demethylubiquinone-9 3-methyltransferase (glyoxalase superfamily)